MAFLAPLAAGAAGAGTAAAAIGTGAALKTGIAAGTALGSGVGLKLAGATLAPTLGASLGATGAGLGGAGLAGLGGMGLKAGAGMLAPGLGATLPGLASAGGAGLAGLGGVGLKAGAGSLMPKFASLSATGLPTAPGLVSRFAPNLAGQDQVLAAFSRQGLGQGFPELGKYAGEVTRLPGVDFTKGVLGNAPKVGAAPTMSTAPSTTLAESIRNVSTAMKGPVNMSYAPGAQGISSNVAALPPGSPIVAGESFLQNMGNFLKDPSMEAAIDYAKEHPYATASAAYGLYGLMNKPGRPPTPSPGLIRPYEFERTQRPEAYESSPVDDSSERLYFNDQFIAGTPYEAPGPEYKKAGGGIVSLAVGGPVEQMAAMNSMGANTGYPMAGINTPLYSNPMMQRPEATNVISPSGDAGVNAFSGEPRFAEGGEAKTEGGYRYSYDPKTMQFTQLSVPTLIPVSNRQVGVPSMSSAAASREEAPRPVKNSGSKISGGILPPVGGSGIAALTPQVQAAQLNIPAYQSPEERLGLTDFYAMMNSRLGQIGGYAAGGGVSDLGGYSDGGRLLKGPGDGVSDSIPAVIGERQPARLADGEFVVPARIVSELGNGSTEAGARKLYAMMDRVQKSRRKTVGKNRVAANTRADKHLPA